MEVSLLPISDRTTHERFESRVRQWLRINISIEQERRDVQELFSEVAANNTSHTVSLLELFVEIMRGEIAHEDEMPYLSYVLTHDLEDDVLDMIVQTFDPEYFEMVSGLLYSQNEDHIGLGIRNIRYIFQGAELDRSALEHLYSGAYEKGLAQLTEYITSELEGSRSEYAPIPEWMIPGNRTHSRLIDALSIEAPPRWVSKSAEADARYIASLVEDDKDIEDVFEQLVDKLRAMTVSDREDMISDLVKQNNLMLLALNPELFRVLGPCLAMGQAYEMRLKSRDPCNMFGGCRVYTCHENENLDPNTSELIIEDPVTSGRLHELEWFTGRCANEQCKLLIRKKCHAVRLPIPTEGGWLGCYCSFFCLRQVAAESSDVIMNLLAAFEGQYLEWGIYERDD